MENYTINIKPTIPFLSTIVLLIAKWAGLFPFSWYWVFMPVIVFFAYLSLMLCAWTIYAFFVDLTAPDKEEEE